MGAAKIAVGIAVAVVFAGIIIAVVVLATKGIPGGPSQGPAQVSGAGGDASGGSGGASGAGGSGAGGSGAGGSGAGGSGGASGAGGSGAGGASGAGGSGGASESGAGGSGGASASGAGGSGAGGNASGGSGAGGSGAGAGGSGGASESGAGGSGGASASGAGGSGGASESGDRGSGGASESGAGGSGAGGTRRRESESASASESASESASASGVPLPAEQATTLASWPFELGEAGESCSATCARKGLVCDSDSQGRTTYGRAVAFDALRRGGVAQYAQSEDEWRGAVRVRDNHRSHEQGRAAPGLWMNGSAGTPNWKGEQDTSEPSTCEAGYTNVRRVCACRAPVFTSAPVQTTAPRPMELSVGERATGLATRFVYERGRGLFPNTPERGAPNPTIRRYLMPESNKVAAANGTFVLVIELTPGALEQLGGSDVQLFWVSEHGGNGDPEIVLSRARGFRVKESGHAKEIDAPAYYAGTKLAYINDRTKSTAEMVVRAGDKTVAVNLSKCWPGGSNDNGLIDIQLHDFVQRAVFLWGPGDAPIDVSALKAEI